MGNEKKEEKKPTLGQSRVRVEFNPSKTDYVHELKMSGANFIDLVDGSACNPKFKDEEVREFMRLKALAMTAIEEATMWAVKSATL